MFKLILLCNFVLGLALANPVENFQESPRPFIVNGTNSEILEYPYIVSLRYRNRHWCGGTILSPDWILTGAQCVEDSEDVSDYSIQFGSTRINSEGSNVVIVNKIVIHEQYDPISLANEIAVLRVAVPIDMGETENRVRLPIPNQYFMTGTPAVLVGWGRNETSGFLQEHLQKTHLSIYSARDCYEAHQGGIFFQNICAGTNDENGGKGQCNGDSGGPLFVNGVQVGVASWSNKPCGSPFPGVFTGVTNYIQWIQKKTGIVFDLHFFLRSKL